MPHRSPLQAYQQALSQQGFEHDAAQWYAVQALENCFAVLQQNAPQPVRGVYLQGPVGRGKTWLMDLFFASLNIAARRQHFHHFMRWVHQRLFALHGTADPLVTLAQELANDARVLCFDELFVNDIGDAILLGRLFQLLFGHGVCVIATSNQMPEQLYADGFNRERFLPAIAAIKKHMQIIALGEGQDHRLHPGQLQQRYWINDGASDAHFITLFDQLNQQGAADSGTIDLAGRTLTTLRHSETVLCCRFADLCQQPFSALDFIALCDRFSTILLCAVPALSAVQTEAYIARGTEDAIAQVLTGDRKLPALAAHDDSVRRFIALVDECYDRRIPLYIDAAVPLNRLYQQGYLTSAFARTRSRLSEMQWQRYGSPT